MFNSEVEYYLENNQDSEADILSLDEFLENINDEDGKGFGSTSDTKNEDTALLTMTFNELTEQDAKMGKIINLLAEGYQKKEILVKVALGKGKTQGYAFIEKTKKLQKIHMIRIIVKLNI